MASHETPLNFDVHRKNTDEVYDPEPNQIAICHVKHSGLITGEKPVYFKGMDYRRDLRNNEMVSESDLQILKKSISQGVHIVCFSAIESPDDIIKARKVLEEMKGHHVSIIAKIQTKKGLENFDEILQVADGIVIARGYLGISLNNSIDVVFVQKYIISKCNVVGKPVIL